MEDVVDDTDMEGDSLRILFFVGLDDSGGGGGGGVDVLLEDVVGLESSVGIMGAVMKRFGYTIIQ